jgi:hypothetical protein
MNETRRTKQFVAVDDKGEEYIVCEYRDFMEKVHPGRPSEWFEHGRQFLLLDDGSHVNQIDADTFKIVETDQIIRRKVG